MLEMSCIRDLFVLRMVRFARGKVAQFAFLVIPQVSTVTLQGRMSLTHCKACEVVVATVEIALMKF